MKPELRIEKIDSLDSTAPGPSTQQLPQGGKYFRFVRATCAAIFRLYFRLEFHGFEQVPKRGPFIVSPNHQSYLDPFWV